MSDLESKTIKSEVSFTKEVKEEIALFSGNIKSSLALLSAFIKVNGNLLVRNNNWILVIKTENIKAAKLVIKLLKEIFDSHTKITISEKKRLRVNQNNKIIHIEVLSNVKTLLTTLQIYDDDIGFKALPNKEFLKQPDIQRTYLAGAFLASGSVNSPTTSEYHLEISVNDKEYADYLSRWIKKFNLSSKVIKRRTQFVVYIKRSDQIADFLKIVSAYKSLMKYEDIRIQRDQLNSMNRVYNCDIANEMKALANGTKQQKMLAYLEKRLGLDKLDEPLQVVASLRYANPEASLNELATLYTAKTGKSISKSGVNHKLRKLMEIGLELGGELDD